MGNFYKKEMLKSWDNFCKKFRDSNYDLSKILISCSEAGEEYESKRVFEANNKN